MLPLQKGRTDRQTSQASPLVGGGKQRDDADPSRVLFAADVSGVSRIRTWARVASCDASSEVPLLMGAGQATRRLFLSESAPPADVFTALEMPKPWYQRSRP